MQAGPETSSSLSTAPKEEVMKKAMLSLVTLAALTIVLTVSAQASFIIDTGVPTDAAHTAGLSGFYYNGPADYNWGSYVYGMFYHDCRCYYKFSERIYPECHYARSGNDWHL